MRTFFWIWLFVLLLASAAKHFKLFPATNKPSASITASTDLPANKELVAGDLQIEGNHEKSKHIQAWWGKFLVNRKKKGETVSDSDIQDRPVLTIAKDSLVFLLQLKDTEKNLSSILSIGAKIMICTSLGNSTNDTAETALCIPDKLVIVAIKNDTSSTKDQWLLLGSSKSYLKDIPVIINSPRRTILLLND